MAAAGRRGHWREADLPEPDLLGEVAEDPLDVHLARGERDPRANRAAAVPLQQLLDLRRHDVVAARAVVEDAELVLHFLRPVDRNRDAHLILGEELDDVGLEQRAVGGQAEIDLLAELGAALPGVGDRLLQHREVQQRFAAEERHVCHLVVAGLPEHEVDAVARRLLAHELRLPSVLGVDDLVLAGPVAVLQLRLHWLVTFSTIVVSGNGASGITLGVGRDRRVDLGDRLHARELGERGVHGVGYESDPASTTGDGRPTMAAIARHACAAAPGASAARWSAASSSSKIAALGTR